jgi:hypothetical protein
MNLRILSLFSALAQLIFLFSCSPPVLVATYPGKENAVNNKISPSQAYQSAMPYLEQTFQNRCQSKHQRGSHWCDKKPTDYIMQKGKWYYITRSSYPYKTLNAYLRYAVLVHTETGEVRLDKMED